MDVLKRLKNRTKEADIGLLMDCMESAASAIMSRRFPYGGYPTTECGEPIVETQYQDLQYRIALDIYNRIGAEGETAHSENGISRSYDGSWISNKLLEEIVPKCGVSK